ncbi:major facilitator superfamily domain-containing protein [Melanogaster broomeanus]|nr:major facilitator superfamily domain-containing protein [Melanogaster broomeanus]
MSQSISPVVTTAQSSAVDGAPATGCLDNTVNNHPTYQHDFCFLPIPKPLRYDPEKPFHFGILLNAFFGISSTLVCANLYYCQPILIQLSSSFSVTYREVSVIPTLVQAGYGVGLLCVSPLGDMVRRRGLILLLVFLSTCLTIGLGITKNIYVFEAVSFLIAFASVSPQILITLAADLAPPHRRASAISISAVLFGSYFVLPDYPANNRGLSYFGMFRSMAKFMVTEPLVVQIVLISIAASACYTNFWVTLTFLLGGSPYYYSTLFIGLFGLFGILGVVVVPFMGCLVDRLPPWHVALTSTLLLIAFQAVQTAAGGINVAAVVITSFGLDVSRQTQQVALTTLIISESARSRLNSLLVLAILLGQVMGTSVGTEIFVGYGWRASSILSMGWFAWQLGILLLRGPHCPRQRWVGWQGGMGLKKEAGSRASDKPSRSDCELGEASQTASKSLVAPETDSPKT